MKNFKSYNSNISQQNPTPIASANTNLEKMRVAESGLTALINRLGKDCSNIQFFREFVKNSVEAIQRRDCEGGEIWIDYAKDLIENEVVKCQKMSITDTGCGMSGPEIVQNFNHLSSSGGVNEHENYGIGAKIAGITYNRAGILIQSWKDGIGVMALWRFCEKTQQYGLERFPTGDGSFSAYVDITDSEDYLMPDGIQKHGGFGTRIILLGNTEEQNTMLPPEGAPGGLDYWTVQNANRRFFELPQKITLWCRVAPSKDDPKYNALRQALGMQAILKKHAIESSTTTLSDCRIHWCVLKPEAHGHGREPVFGHTAFLNQGELIDFSKKRPRAAQFGITFGAAKVVLYIEPTEGYSQNASRTMLISDDGTPVPTERWAAEFRDRMPKAIQTLVKNEMGKSSIKSKGDTIAKRLEKFAAFFSLSRYTAHASGTIPLDPDAQIDGKTGVRRYGNPKSLPSPSVQSLNGTTAGNIITKLTRKQKSKSILKGHQLAQDPFPKVTWVSKADGNRVDGELDDRAASYYPDDYMIKANGDFIGFLDLICHFNKEYNSSGDDEHAEFIKSTVSEQFEQLLTEVVAGAQSFEGREHWTEEDAQVALSEEALTAAVAPRYFIMREIDRVLQKGLGPTVAKAVNDS